MCIYIDIYIFSNCVLSVVISSICVTELTHEVSNDSQICSFLLRLPLSILNPYVASLPRQTKGAAM